MYVSITIPHPHPSATQTSLHRRTSPPLTAAALPFSSAFLWRAISHRTPKEVFKHRSLVQAFIDPDDSGLCLVLQVKSPHHDCLARAQA